MPLLGFGEHDETLGYRTLDEREVRGSSGLTLAVGLVAVINGFVLQRYDVLPWLTGFLALNFLVAVSLGPKLSPTFALARLLTWRQTPLPIGAIQKRFAWTLGFLMTASAFGLSLLLLQDPSWFEPVCLLCIVCLLLLFLETAFGICVGCYLYRGLVRVGIFPRPAVKPNCMGDACPTD
jgi:hypothetical protein